jgi:hypothetical protein
MSWGYDVSFERSNHKMKTTRSNFFWHGLVNENKYHMMKWEVLDSPLQEIGFGCTYSTIDYGIYSLCLCAFICESNQGQKHVR